MPDRALPEISVVVVSYNSAGDLRACLEGMRDPRIELLVVDNASQDGSAALAGRVGGATVTALPVNIGWSRGCNIGIGQASAPVVALVNPDARPQASQLIALKGHLEDPAVGSVSPQFLEPDGSSQSFFFRFPDPWTGPLCFFNAGQRLDALLGSPAIRRRTYDFGARLPGAVDQPGAACLLLRTADVRELGGLSNELFLFFADTDLCLRQARRGQEARVAWDVRVEHRGGGSVLALPEGQARMHLQRDYLSYVRMHHGSGAWIATKGAAVLLTGIVPAVLRVIRGQLRAALQQLVLAARVVR